MRKIILPLVFSVLLVFEVVAAQSFTAVEVPELHSAVVFVADLFAQDEPNMIIGHGRNVSLFLEGSMVPLIQDISGCVSALTIGDLNGDLRNELVVGTDNGGALYFYTLRDGIWQRQGQPQYLWDTISLLEVHDFNEDGWGDILALTEKGEAYVLLSREGTLSPLWKSEPDEVVVGIEVIDLAHSNYPGLVYALQSGYIAVLNWDGQEFVVLWENYPWGIVDSLVILPQQNRTEWLVLTSQKMLYGWRFQDGEVVSSRLFDAKELGEHLFYFPGKGLLSLSKKTGISLFELQSSSVLELWRIPGIYGDYAFSYQDDLYFKDKRNVYHKLVQGSAKWRFFIYDQEVTEAITVLQQEDEFFYRLEDVAEFVELKRIPRNSWQYLSGRHDILLEFEENSLKYDGLNIPLKNPILNIEGVPYVSAEVFPLFGWRVESNCSKQQIIFQKIWGWWM